MLSFPNSSNFLIPSCVTSSTLAECLDPGLISWSSVCYSYSSLAVLSNLLAIIWWDVWHHNQSSYCLCLSFHGADLIPARWTNDDLWKNWSLHSKIQSVLEDACSFTVAWVVYWGYVVVPVAARTATSVFVFVLLFLASSPAEMSSFNLPKSHLSVWCSPSRNNV